VTGNSNTTNTKVSAPSPSSTKEDSVDSPSDDYRFRQRQRQRRAGQTTMTSEQTRRRDQVVTPNSVGGGNAANTTNPGVITGDADDDDELECEEVDADELSVESSSRPYIIASTPMTLVYWMVSSMIFFVTWIS
jgi:hypothetical protein